MQRALSLMSRHIDASLPPGLLAADPERLRRARLTLWFTVVFFSQVMFFLPVCLVAGVPYFSLCSAGNGCALAIVPWVMRRFSLEAAVHWQILAIVAVLNMTTWFHGGISGPVVSWFTLVPVMATMTAGRRSGYIWLVIVALNAAGFGALELAHWTPASIVPVGARVPLMMVSYGMLAFVALALALVYEATKERMRAALDATNADMRRVLDSVGQGFFTSDANGRPSAQRSSILMTWFGAVRDEAAPFWRWLARYDRAFAEWVALGWEALFEQVLPIELLLDQLPTRLHGEDGRQYNVDYRPVLSADGRLQSVVLVLSDVTAQLVADEAERSQREQANLFERLSRDRSEFLQFWDESLRMIEELGRGSDGADRLIHTLKGTSAVFGLESVAAACQIIERRLADSSGAATADDCADIASAWSTATRRIAAVLEAERQRFEVTRDEYETLGRAIAERVKHEQLAAMLAAWRYERTADSFARLAEQATALAQRMDRAPLDVTIDDGDVRLDPADWAPIWSEVVHAVRTAIDPGIERPEERAAAGKPARAALRLTSRQELDGAVVLEIADDGRGIDWDRVRRRAIERNLPHASLGELASALFCDGFSTRDELTEISGRGVGLAALAAAAQTVRAVVELESLVAGAGTTVRLHTRPSSALQRVA